MGNKLSPDSLDISSIILWLSFPPPRKSIPVSIDIDYQASFLITTASTRDHQTKHKHGDLWLHAYDHPDVCLVSWSTICCCCCCLLALGSMDKKAPEAQQKKMRIRPVSRQGLSCWMDYFCLLFWFKKPSVLQSFHLPRSTNDQIGQDEQQVLDTRMLPYTHMHIPSWPSDKDLKKKLDPQRSSSSHPFILS